MALKEDRTREKQVSAALKADLAKLKAELLRVKKGSAECRQLQERLERKTQQVPCGSWRLEQLSTSRRTLSRSISTDEQFRELEVADEMHGLSY